MSFGSPKIPRVVPPTVVPPPFKPPAPLPPRSATGPASVGGGASAVAPGFNASEMGLLGRRRETTKPRRQLLGG